MGELLSYHTLLPEVYACQLGLLTKLVVHAGIGTPVNRLSVGCNVTE